MNVFLNRVVDPLLAEEAARFDPTMDDTDTPYGLSYTGLMQLLVSWREAAWRNAERLVTAATAQDRERATAEIERSAVLTGQLIAEEQAYRPPVSSAAARNAFCADHHG